MVSNDHGTPTQENCNTFYTRRTNVRAHPDLNFRDVHPANKITDIFKLTYGRNHTKWKVYWRIFFMACSELWKTSNGNEWQVSHYLFKKK